MYDNLSYTTSDELCEQMSQECDTILLSFSCGKDSVASWLQCRKYFKHIVPYYRWLIPDLEFVEDNLKYYEDFFGQKIYRFPSPNYYRMLRDGVFQTYSRWSTIRMLNAYGEMPTSQYTELLLAELIREVGKLPEGAYCAIGNRASDSPMRRMNIAKNGSINHNRKTFYPVYDWLQERLVREIEQSGVKLATDYALWNNTFDSMSYKYLSEMREHLPKDYAKCLWYFPMAQCEFWRRGER